MMYIMLGIVLGRLLAIIERRLMSVEERVIGRIQDVVVTLQATDYAIAGFANSMYERMAYTNLKRRVWLGSFRFENDEQPCIITLQMRGIDQNELEYHDVINAMIEACERLADEMRVSLLLDEEEDSDEIE